MLVIIHESHKFEKINQNQDLFKIIQSNIVSFLYNFKKELHTCKKRKIAQINGKHVKELLKIQRRKG